MMVPGSQSATVPDTSHILQDDTGNYSGLSLFVSLSRSLSLSICVCLYIYIYTHSHIIY